MLNNFSRIKILKVNKNTILLSYMAVYQHGIRVRPDNLVSIYGRVLGSNLRFRKPEKLLDGEETRGRQTHGSVFSRYRVMVNSQVVLSGKNVYVVFLSEAM